MPAIALRLVQREVVGYQDEVGVSKGEVVLDVLPLFTALITGGHIVVANLCVKTLSFVYNRAVSLEVLDVDNLGELDVVVLALDGGKSVHVGGEHLAIVHHL
jgi:hypothetical protein